MSMNGYFVKCVDKRRVRIWSLTLTSNKVLNAKLESPLQKLLQNKPCIVPTILIVAIIILFFHLWTHWSGILAHLLIVPMNRMIRFIELGSRKCLYTQGFFISESCWISPKSDCIYYFPIILTRNGRPFGSESIGKGWIRSDFSLIHQDSEKNFFL